MKAWIFLMAAILFEVVATTALKACDGFTKPGPSVIVVLGYGCAFYCLSLTLRSIPVGVAYAVWAGLGMALISVLGYLVYGQKLNVPTMLGIGLILAGVVVLNLGGGGEA